MGKILIIDDDVASCRTLQLHFTSNGHQVQLAHSVNEGLENAHKQSPELIILDIRMPGRDGLEGLPEFKTLHPNTPVIMITAYDDMDSTILAMKRGADDYIRKPIDINELDMAVTRALDRIRLDEGDRQVIGDENLKPGTNTMVGRSNPMQEVYKTIGLVAPKPVTVLITGESGTGKELVARAIHQAGPTPNGPFVAINCAAIVETLLESELFGHEKGSFTGAISRQAGKFELAEKGTIFLDEVGELSPSVQAKLLRVLQEKEYVLVGGTTTRTTNARVVAATNVDLTERVRDGRFREDLFYRLQVINIEIPALRDRTDDIDDLVPTLLNRINREMHRTLSVTGVALDVMDTLKNYDWPGNIRELENVLMKAAAVCQGNTITIDLLPAHISGGQVHEAGTPRQPEELSLKDVEKSHISRVLTATNWHRGRTCEILGISRPRLRRLISQFDLTPPAGQAKHLDDLDDDDEQ
ncbi:sigma-54-dependent transcriptional regulator [Pseudomonadota bacterium]